MPQLELAQMEPTIAFTGERIVPGMVSQALFREHECRYQFAGAFVKGLKVLDVASGTGIGTDYLRRAGASSCVGLDINLPTLRFASATYRACRFAAANAAQLPFATGSFDAVVSFETIEHLPDPELFVGECARVLKPAGMMICSTPNSTIYDWYGTNHFHVREFKVKDFGTLLASHFGKIRLYSQQEVIYPAFVIRRISSALLRRMGLADRINAILRRRPPSSARECNFGASASGEVGEITAYKKKWFSKPSYILAITEKASGQS